MCVGTLRLVILMHACAHTAQPPTHIRMYTQKTAYFEMTQKSKSHGLGEHRVFTTHKTCRSRARTRTHTLNLTKYECADACVQSSTCSGCALLPLQWCLASVCARGRLNFYRWLRAHVRSRAYDKVNVPKWHCAHTRCGCGACACHRLCTYLLITTLLETTCPHTHRSKRAHTLCRPLRPRLQLLHFLRSGTNRVSSRRIFTIVK
jgi:hypothetical protein